VGFPACPSDACAKVRNIPGIRLLSRKGGDAVVREFAEKLFPELFE
jgi:N-acylneuraminate cytidylyltransferase